MHRPVVVALLMRSTLMIRSLTMSMANGEVGRGRYKCMHFKRSVKHGMGAKCIKGRGSCGS